MCDILRKQKVSCEKGTGHSEGFSNLIVANVLNNTLQTRRWS